MECLYYILHNIHILSLPLSLSLSPSLLPSLPYFLSFLSLPPSLSAPLSLFLPSSFLPAFHLFLSLPMLLLFELLCVMDITMAVSKSLLAGWYRNSIQLHNLYIRPCVYHVLNGIKVDFIANTWKLGMEPKHKNAKQNDLQIV